MPKKIKVLIIVAFLLQLSVSIGVGKITSSYISHKVSERKALSIDDTVRVLESNTVTYNSDGGSEVAPMVARLNTPVTKPADPTKDGYSFAGWQLDGKAFDFNTKIDKDITLTAAWTKVEATPTTTTTATSTASAAITPVVSAPAVVTPVAPTYRYTKEQVIEKLNSAISAAITQNDAYKVLDTRYITGPFLYYDTSIADDAQRDVGGSVAFDTANGTLIYKRFRGENGSQVLECVYSFKTKTVSFTNPQNYPGSCPAASLFESEFTNLLNMAGVTSDEYLQ